MQSIPVNSVQSSIRGDIFFNVGSQLFLRFVTAASALYAARVLGPAQFGLWAVLQVIFMYTAQAHLGTVNAMLRNVPIFLAKGDTEAVRATTNSTWTFVLFSSIVACLSTGVIIWQLLPASQPYAVLIALGSAWLVMVQLQSVFFQFYCRAYVRFKLLAALSTVQAIITLPLCVWLIPKLGIAGYLFALCAGFTLVSVIVMFCLGLSFRFSHVELGGLLTIGIPMLPATLALYLSSSIERVVLAASVGTTAVGIFVAGAFFFQVGGTIWELIVYTWYSRLAKLHAESGHLQLLVQAFQEIIPGALWVSSLIQGVIYILLPATLRQILPQYSNSIAIAQVLVLFVNLWGIAQLLSFSMSIISRQNSSAILQVMFLVLKLVLLLCFLAIYRTPMTVAITGSIAVLAYACSTFVIWKRIAGNRFVSGRLSLLMWGAPVAAAIACAGLLTTGSVVQILALYVIGMLGCSIFIAKKSQAFRGLYAWSLAA